MIRVFSQYISAKVFLLVIIEALLMIGALLCGARLRFWNDPDELSSYTKLPLFAWQAGLFVMVFQVCFHYGSLYDLVAMRERNQHVIGLGQSLGAGCLVLGMLYYVFPAFQIGRGVFFISTALLAIFVLGSRVVLDAAWQVAGPRDNLLVLGVGELAVKVAREVKRRNDLSVNMVGFVEVGPGPHCRELFGRPVVGTASELEQIVAEHKVSRIVVAIEDRRGVMPVRELVTVRVQGIRVEDAHSAIAALSGRVWLDTVRPSWFVFSDGFRRARPTTILKRSVDLACALIGLLVSFPIMLLVALAIKLESKGAVIFRQTRVGLGGRTFSVLKFRSMRADAEAHTGAQWAQENDPRVTRVGRYLRKFRLDELPQFVNVLRGEMSFVGPRPERPEFVKELRERISYYDERHAVRPGLTGWAQVQYRYGASVDDAFRKLEYDLFYLKNMSLSFDLVIILQTIRIVFGGHGAR